MSIRLVLADDHPIVLDGLAQLLRLAPDMDVVARASNGVEALRAVRRHNPDILVLDLHMPMMDGLAVVRAMAHEALPTKIVVLTGFGGDNTVEAIELGVRGVVLKEMAPALLVRAVREVYEGRTWIERDAVPRVVDRLRHRSIAEGEIAATLTPRELEIARMIVKGLPTRVVAERMKITEGTAKLHLHHVYEKLGLTGRFELMQYLLIQRIR